MNADRTRRIAAEATGTAMLLAAVVGSGIMADRLAGGNQAIALLANAVATGAALVAAAARSVHTCGDSRSRTGRFPMRKGARPRMCGGFARRSASASLGESHLDLVHAGRDLDDVAAVDVRIDHLARADDFDRHAGQGDRVRRVAHDADHADGRAGSAGGRHLRAVLGHGG